MAEKIKVKKRIINLIPDKGDNLLSQFLSWGLTVGRLLIIITETLALSVFLYRFSLDVKIIDLHDKIKSAKVIVENFKDSEDSFRNLQARLGFIKEYDTKKDRTLTLLQDIIELGRNRITFRNLIVSISSVEVEAQAPSADALTAFVQGIKNHPEIGNVTIDRVQNSTTEGLVTVSIIAELKSNLRQTKLTKQTESATAEE
jgi:hypothetical protein